MATPSSETTSDTAAETPKVETATTAPETVTPDSSPSAEEPATAAVDVSEDGDDGAGGLVSQLDAMLQEFADAVTRPGREPADFRDAAKIQAAFTRFIVQYPKVEVLDAYLNFITEHRDTAADPYTYMLGSTTLNTIEERQVGFLYNLFNDLANKSNVAINNALVVQVLKKPEIANYYNRRRAGYMQNG